MLRQQHLDGKVPAAGKFRRLPDLAGLTSHHEVEKPVGVDLLVADGHPAFPATTQAPLASLHVKGDAKGAQGSDSHDNPYPCVIRLSLPVILAENRVSGSSLGRRSGQ